MAGRGFPFLCGLLLGLGMVAAFSVGVKYGEKRAGGGYTERVDTLLVYDTITRVKPVYIASTPIVRYDTLRLHDTIALPVPIERRVYADSHYRAVVSGWHPSLDSISVYERTRTITRVVPDSRKWGLGVQAGVGFSPAGVQPYVGLGVSYNLLSW